MSDPYDVLRRAADEIDFDLGVRDLPRVPPFLDPPDGYVEAHWNQIAADLSVAGGHSSVRGVAGRLLVTATKKRADAEEEEAFGTSIAHVQSVVDKMVDLNGDMSVFELIDQSMGDGSRLGEDWVAVRDSESEYELRLPPGSDALSDRSLEALKAQLRPSRETTLGQMISGLTFAALTSRVRLLRKRRLAGLAEYRLRFVEQALLEYELFGVAIQYDERAHRPVFSGVGDEAEIFILRAVAGIKKVEAEERAGMRVRTVSALKTAIVEMENPESNAPGFTVGAVDRLLFELDVYRPRPQRGRPSTDESLAVYEEVKARIERLASNIVVFPDGPIQEDDPI